MKKILLATTLLVVLTSAAFADGKNSNAKLLNNLKTALKSVNESAWTATETYRKTSFTFNGNNTNAYIDATSGDLIGFGIAVNEDALPQGTLENLAKKFQGWKMINQTMFIDASGNTTYYVQVNKAQKSLALQVSPKGKLSIYARMYQ